MPAIGFGRLLCVFALVAMTANAQIPREEYHERRTKIQKDFDGILVLAGWQEGPDEVYRTYQESNFYYLTGWQEPGAILVVTPKREVLFLPKRNERKERYNGTRLAYGDPGANEKVGIAEVAPLEQFESRLAQLLPDGQDVYTLISHPFAAKLKALVPMRDMRDATSIIGKLRTRKSAAEIAAIQKATDVSMDAHRQSWKRLKAGAYEYNASSVFTQAVLDAGCARHAYEPIFGSGPNSTILHYNANDRRMDSGELILIDAGASCQAYASDITRTLPVNGKFTDRQRQIYEVVLGAQKAAIDAARPGVTPAKLGEIARKYMDEHGGLGKYLTHGISHHVGLDVHDPGPPNVPLEKDNVVTVEPGIYIPEERFGVRIEDVILITDGPAKVLSGALAKESPEVEKTLVR